MSPTGHVYAVGIPPTETRRSQTATLFLRQGQPDRWERALELSREGIDADSLNPIHYFLAGAALARLARYPAADSMWNRAQGLYPAYELEIEPEREAAWGEAFNAGLEAYAGGDAERTRALWRGAIVMSDLRPAAHRNLASVLTLEGRYDEAVQLYFDALAGLDRLPAARVLGGDDRAERARATAETEVELASLLLLGDRFAEAEPILRRRLADEPESVALRGDLAAALSGMGRDAEARALYAELLSEEGLRATQLFNFGVALFRASDFAQASEAFERLTRLQPESRDAWFNLANSLFAAEAWAPLRDVGPRLLTVDPLSENAHLITARAHLEEGDEASARALLARVDSVPAFVSQLRLRRSGAETTVGATAETNPSVTDAPERLTLDVIFHGADGSELQRARVTVDLRDGSSTPFEATVRVRAASFRYELVSAGPAGG